jgi:hypothetical protein
MLDAWSGKHGELDSANVPSGKKQDAAFAIGNDR